MEEVKSLHPLIHDKTPQQMYDEGAGGASEPLPFNHLLTKANLTLEIVENSKSLSFSEWQNIFALFPQLKELQIGEWKFDTEPNPIEDELKDVNISDLLFGVKRNSSQEPSILTNWIMKGKTESKYNDYVRHVVKTSIRVEMFQGTDKACYYNIYKNLLENTIRYGSFPLFISLFVHLYETEEKYVHSIFEENVGRYGNLACLYQNINVFYVAFSYNGNIIHLKNFLYTFVIRSRSTELTDYIAIKLLSGQRTKSLSSATSLCCHNEDWKKLSHLKEILTKNSCWNYSNNEVKTTLLSLFQDRRKQVWICASLDLSSPST